MTQLPLALAHPPHYGRDTFVEADSNREALRLIEAWPRWPAHIVVLSGPPGSGKTHLAHIWASLSGAFMLPATELGGEAPPEKGPMLAVEDVDLDAVPERALFHITNATQEAGGSMLVTSRSPIADWRLSLPDLRSRLRLATPLAIGAPDDALIRIVLVKLFADRQLIVDMSVIDYLVLRMERSLSVAAHLVDALDRTALSAGRRITRPMAASILAAP